MALFNSQNTVAALNSVSKTNGFVYFVVENQKLYVDVNNTRYSVNGDMADTLKYEDENGVVDLDAAQIIQRSRPRTYTVTIAPGNWTQGTDETYSFTWVNTYIQCGEDGRTPPIIVCTDNEDEYANISSAVVDTEAGTIKFTTAIKPESNISILAIDF